MTSSSHRLVVATVLLASLFPITPSLAQSCPIAPPTVGPYTVGGGFEFLSFQGFGTANGWGRCDDYNNTGLSYNVISGEQHITISSNASGKGDAQIARRITSSPNQLYTADALARIINVNQTTLGDFRGRLKMAPRVKCAGCTEYIQEYECGTLLNSGEVTGGAVSPFVDITVPSPVNQPVSVECMTASGFSDQQMVVAWRARRQPTSGASGSATGTAVMGSIVVKREL